MTPIFCRPSEIREAMNRGGCQVIDVREPAEVATERIPGLRLLPLSSFDRHVSSVATDQPVYLVCQSGKRAADAAQRLARRGHPDVRVLEGGLLAWSAAGLPVEKGTSRVWSLERQVRFVAGALSLAGALLAAFVAPEFVALSGLVGAGLMFAGITDTCGMAMILARMPWNQRTALTCTVPEAN